MEKKIWGNSALSVQFFCKPRTALKDKTDESKTDAGKKTRPLSIFGMQRM